MATKVKKTPDEWMASLHNMAEIEANETNLENAVKKWVEVMDQA